MKLKPHEIPFAIKSTTITGKIAERKTFYLMDIMRTQPANIFEHLYASILFCDVRAKGWSCY